MKNIVRENVILASGSPRRHQLLKTIIPNFIVAPGRDIDEKYPESLPVDDVAPYLATLKAEGYSDLATEGNLVISADTVVLVDDSILGKPHDEKEAIEMLQRLVNHSHKVVTGVAIKTAERLDVFKETTEVTFGEVSLEDIRQYVREYRPMDKAGAYGIQEWIGCIGITSIRGCYYNVMGLPLHTLYLHLKKFSD